MMGKHVTTSSSGTTASRLNGACLRKTSIQIDVSTRTTTPPGLCPLLDGVAILAQRAEIAFPRAGSGEREDLPRSYAAHEFLQRASYRC